MTKDRDTVIAVVGGGRWGRTSASVLSSMDLPFDRIVVVSQANSKIVNDLLEVLRGCSKAPLSLVSSVDELTTNYNVRAAVVVNSAHQHFETASQLIDCGVNVLVEKPLSLYENQVDTLIEKARSNNVCLVPGLNYRFCSYLDNFSKYISSICKPLLSFKVEWWDPSGEVRYNEAKTYDPRINVAQDVMPHIWSIFSILFPEDNVHFKSCRTSSRMLNANFSANLGDARGHVLIKREATTRRRKISLTFDSQEEISLDFTKEPGIIYSKNLEVCADPDWNQKSGPLAIQLEYFFAQIVNGMITENDAHSSKKSVSFTQRASELLSLS